VTTINPEVAIQKVGRYPSPSASRPPIELRANGRMPSTTQQRSESATTSSRVASSQGRLRDREPGTAIIGDMAVRDFYTAATDARVLDASLET
jgi:hypothetical protein